MLYYVDNLAETIKFYHSLLKNNGRLIIIIEKGKLMNDLLLMSSTVFCPSSVNLC